MKQLITHIAMWLVKGVIGLAFIAFISIMLVEWAVGCGETYTDSKGKVHINECAFITKKGTN